MVEQKRILVIGATGNVGRQVVSRLRDAGAAVRALARDPASAGLPDGVEVVRGDLSAPDTLEAALDGIESVFLVWPFLTAEDAPAVLDVIAGRGARHVVYLSSTGVREGAEKQGDPINQFHADMERLLEKSELEWTFLRAGGFATNTLQWTEQIRTEGVVRAPFGSTSRPLIHEHDIAAVAVRALTENGHGGAKYALTGPRALTTAEQAHTIGEAIGRPVRFEEVPQEAVREQMLTQGWPGEVVDGILNAQADMAAASEPVTSTVEKVTGTPARTFAQWAADHADDFRPAE
ncbi:uncharacterized protein YbjT (DUF2867 family) [Spinactinospora alkalitolerans]|uniref:Uncharacterized protein YbjT (DUF2867 family) n=1 Tax=Spinactinospora alkalitolerans TaxID=687207 RepID=A0A852U2U1_9ACTN|nr:NAD(P)H-binding protein [Spinactinospora alkalitolerans]NYE49762.1 uncharacterized protein YbjT (DUF2867 family) [Spinactinospora alkalitolerans]